MQKTDNLETTEKSDFSKFGLSKFEHDLYHEEDDIAQPVVRVKHQSLPNKGEKWKIMSDNKVILIVEGNKLGKKERSYLNTLDGFNFLLSQAKSGIKSFNLLKIEIKKILTSKKK